jgi:hypothetical protein
MTTVHSMVRLTLSALAAAAISACARETQQGAALPPVTASSDAGPKKASPLSVERDSSWTAPDAGKGDLLYVANNYDVTIYSYPLGKLVGKLKHHFERPATECSGSTGDVYITDGDNVFVYAHGGKKPLRTLTFSGYLATACSSDPTTGNLAVTYELGFSKAYVAVYPAAKGTPTLYQAGDLIFARCGYDPSGNLYVDGIYGSGPNFGFVELPKGRDQLETVTLNQSFKWPGDVQWDGKYVTVGDDVAENIYRFTISGSRGTLVGTTSLAGAPAMVNWWIDGHNVVGGNGDSPPAVYYWDYPAGGNPVKTITEGLLYPDGVTVSGAKH